jgi:O-antigen ligase
MQMKYFSSQPTSDRIIFAGMLLLSFSLALSKSAVNIILGLLLLYAVALAVFRREFRASLVKNWSQPLLLSLTLFLSVAVIGLLFTENLPDGIGITNKIAGLLLVYYLVSVLLDSLEDGKGKPHIAERLLMAFLIGIFALNIIGVMTYLGIIDHKRFVLPLAPLHVHHIWFSNLNAVGMYTAAAFLLFSPQRGDTGRKLFLSVFLVLGGVSVLLSLSRTAWLGLFVTAVVLTYLCVKKKKIFFITFMAALAAAVLLYLFNGIVHERLNLIVTDISLFFTGEAQTNIGERFLMWKAAIRMFLTNPLFGVGTGDYVSTMNRYMASGEYPAYLAWFNQPHNMYLFTLATNGLVGLAALLYIFYRGLRFALPLLKSGGRERLFAFVAAATAVHYMVAGMMDSFFNIQMLRYAFAFILGVCARNSMKRGNVKL